MSNSESGSEQDNGNISPPVEAEITQIEVAGTAEKSVDKLPLWGIGTAKQRLLSLGMVLVYAVIVILLFFVVRLLLSGARNSPPLTRSFLSETLLALGALGATAIAANLEGKKFSSYGLADRLALPRFSWGFFWGFAALTIFLSALRITGHYYFGVPDIHGEQIFKFGLLYVMFFLAVAVLEETLMRGYPLFKLWAAIGFWPAAIILAALFGLGHLSNKGESIFGVVGAGLFGVVIAYSVLRSGTLWWAIGFHFMWDYSESFIYGVPDSGFIAPGHLLNPSFVGPAWITGGTVGPEGSYFILLVLAGLALVIHMTLPGSKAEFTTEAQRHREAQIKSGDTQTT